MLQLSAKALNDIGMQDYRAQSRKKKREKSKEKREKRKGRDYSDSA